MRVVAESTTALIEEDTIFYVRPRMRWGCPDVEHGGNTILRRTPLIIRLGE